MKPLNTPYASSGREGDPQSLNIEAFRTPEAVDKLSGLYKLFPVEKYLFQRYYKPGERVLDLACGAGRTTLILHEMGLSVKGLDASSELVAVANRRFPYLDIKVGLYGSVNGAPASFDHVLISFNGLDYAHPEASRIVAIRQSASVLKSGGTFMFSSHNIKSLYGSPYYLLSFEELAWKLRWSLKAFGEKAYIPEGRLRHFYGSSRYVVHQVEEAGFELVETIGFRLSHNRVFNKYCSPYIHYVFRRTVQSVSQAVEVAGEDRR